MKAANKKDFQSEVKDIGQSCFKNDVGSIRFKYTDHFFAMLSRKLHQK